MVLIVYKSTAFVTTLLLHLSSPPPPPSNPFYFYFSPSHSLHPLPILLPPFHPPSFHHPTSSTRHSCTHIDCRRSCGRERDGEIDLARDCAFCRAADGVDQVLGVNGQRASEHFHVLDLPALDLPSRDHLEEEQQVFCLFSDCETNGCDSFLHSN